MINILPPDLKQQVQYSKRNVVLVRYLLFALLAAVLLGAVVVTSLWFSSKQLSELEQSLAQRQEQRAAYADTETKVESLQASLNLIDKLLLEKTRYSDLLADLAAVLPPGSYISNIALTGDDSKPLEIIVFADSIDTAGLVRNALLTSDRINSVDIQSISRDDENNVFSVEILAAFETGQAQ